MTGVVEEPDPSGPKLRRELAQRLYHLPLGGVLVMYHFEADLGERRLAIFALALQIRVVAREELLCEFEETVFVLFVDSEDRRKDAQRMALRDLVDQVARDGTVMFQKITNATETVT